MKKITLIFGLISFALSACSSSVPVNVVRAPTIEMNNIETLAVNIFDLSGRKNLEYVDSTMIDKVVEMYDRNANLGYAFKRDFKRRHRYGLESALQARKKFKIVSNHKNAQAKVKGDLRLEIKDEGKWVERALSDGEKVNIYQVYRVVKVTVDFQVKHQNKIIGNGSVFKTATSSSENISQKAAIKNLADWENLSYQAIDKTHADVLKFIFPYTQTYQVKLEEGDDDDRVEEGAGIAEDGDWKKATSLWSEVIAEKSGEDLAAAQFNMGVYHEQKGQYSKAINWYKSSLSSYNLESASSGLGRVKAARADRQKINQSKPKINHSKSKAKVNIHKQHDGKKWKKKQPKSQSIEAIDESEESSDPGVGF